MAKINNNLIKKISELTLKNMELEVELKKAKEQIQILKETVRTWAGEVVKNYHENGGNLGKAQAMTGTEIMMYELSRGRVKENESKMEL